jgi:hypothetical protein
MPILIPRTGTSHPIRQLATNAPSCFLAQARCRHDSVAADPLQSQASLEHDVNEDAPPLRVRKHGFRALPMSPLMRGDGAKKPRKQSVTPPSQQAALKEFQKEVALNPYGMHTIDTALLISDTNTRSQHKHSQPPSASATSHSPAYPPTSSSPSQRPSKKRLQPLRDTCPK